MASKPEVSTESKLPVTLSALRLLVLSPQPCSTGGNPTSLLLEFLTHVWPDWKLQSFAGYTSHPPLQLRTRYYNTDVPIWCDEIPFATWTYYLPDIQGPITGPTGPREAAEDRFEKLAEWKDQMLSTTAAEVRRAVGSLVVLIPFNRHTLSTLPETFLPVVKAVNEVKEAVEEETAGREMACVVVLLSQLSQSLSKKEEMDGVVEKFEDVLLGEGVLGWEVVGWDGMGKMARDYVGRNEFGEKIGMERVVEVLEGVDWSVRPEGDGEGLDEEFLDVEGEEGNGEDEAMAGFSMNGKKINPINEDYAEFQMELIGMKTSMLEDEAETGERDDEDFKIGQLPGLFDRIVAIKEAGSDMPKAEREKFARREVERLMKDL